MSDELNEVLRQCEKTGSWYGIKIASLNQTNSIGDTPLHTACSWGELKPVEVLLRNGAGVNAKGDRGCTPIFNAVIGRNPHVVRALRKSGADLTIRSADGQLILEYAKNLRSPKEVLDALVERISKPN
jgi:uncharacterized protein